MHEDKIHSLLYKFRTFNIISHWMPNAIGLWPNEQECILWLALNSDSKPNWMEIGSFCGGSAVLLCLARRLTGDEPSVYSVDMDFNAYGMFDNNVYNKGGFADLSKKIECDSNDLSSYYNGDPLSFVFIDGFHSFKQVVKDFETVKPWLTKDAIIAFHDISPSLESRINKEYDYDKFFQREDEDFMLDEAVAYILQNNDDFELMDIPVKKQIRHFEETGRRSWVRGKTSPFNAVGAIRRTG